MQLKHVLLKPNPYSALGSHPWTVDLMVKVLRVKEMAAEMLVLVKVETRHKLRVGAHRHLADSCSSSLIHLPSTFS